MKIALGLLLALAIGVVCRLAAIPLPAPPVLFGALLVLATTLGYVDHGSPRSASGSENAAPLWRPLWSDKGGRSMSSALVGVLLGFLIGAGCRWFDLPLPAPPRIVGALLVVAMGFLGTDSALVLWSAAP